MPSFIAMPATEAAPILGPQHGRGFGKGQMLSYNSKLFDAKFGQESKNQFDGGLKGGDAWKVLMKGYFVGKLPEIDSLLAWAEKQSTNPITETMERSLELHFEECPRVLCHQLWAFFIFNLTGAARDIFLNAPEGNGFEVWRKIKTS